MTSDALVDELEDVSTEAAAFLVTAGGATALAAIGGLTLAAAGVGL